jgi:hypothetical protein
MVAAADALLSKSKFSSLCELTPTGVIAAYLVAACYEYHSEKPIIVGPDLARRLLTAS